MNKVLPRGKKTYTKEQRERRRVMNMRYEQYERPAYLIDLARSQGHLQRTFSELTGETAQDKLRYLKPDELPRCEARLEMTGCAPDGRIATDIHHKAKRGKLEPHGGDALLNDSTLFVGLCRTCHDYIHAHPEWAYDESWLVKRNVI